MKITIEELERMIFVEKLPYKEIGRIHGISGNGVRKWAKYNGILLPSRRKINSKETFNKDKHTSNGLVCLECGNTFYNKQSNVYCSAVCYLTAKSNKTKERYEQYKEHNGENVPQKANYNIDWIKKFLLEEQEHKCSVCSMRNEWNNKPLIFILDHIDGNASNNKKDNMRLVCSNCDSQLDTYKSKNKNGARSYYRYHKYHKYSNGSIPEQVSTL